MTHRQYSIPGINGYNKNMKKLSLKVELIYPFEFSVKMTVERVDVL